MIVASATTAGAEVRGDAPSSLRMRPQRGSASKPANGSTGTATGGIGSWWKRVAQAASDPPAPDPAAPDPA
ncbi:MAG TPA: hypothetical protein VLM79_29510, partial [Kofleriaceae bacterium]|nr:hypothetical protein [Kofleriaceae bacterium]